MNISLCTVHNTIKWLWESGEISLHKGQGLKSILDACDLQALRQYCINTVTEISTWAQEHCQKTLSVTTIGRAIHKSSLKMYHTKMCEHDTEMPPSSLSQSSLEMNWGKTVLSSNKLKLELILGPQLAQLTVSPHAVNQSASDVVLTFNILNIHVLTFSFGTAFLHNPNKGKDHLQAQNA